MAENKNQHFIPQRYFRFFSEDKRNINLIQKSTGKIIRNIAIKNQCSKNYFYGTSQEDKALTKYEGEYVGLLKKLNLILIFYPKSQDNLKKNLIPFTIYTLIQQYHLKFDNHHC